MLSKSAVTLLSTVGASSVPVISVVALYKIKSLSQGGNVEDNSSATPEELVIKEETVPKPNTEETKTTPQAEEAVTPPPPQPPVVEPKPEANVPAPDESTPKKEEKNDSSIGIKKDTTKTIDTNIQTNDSGEETPKITKPEDLTKLLQDIQNMMKQQLQEALNPTQNKQDISESIKTFVELLKIRKNTLTDNAEKQSIQEVIDALTQLEKKSLTNKN